jgi:hypothetical protein
MGQRAVGVTRSQMSTNRLASLWEESRWNPRRCGKRVWRDKGILLEREDECTLYSTTSVASTKPVREPQWYTGAHE